MAPVEILNLVLLLMAVAVVLALLARRLRVPPAVLFVPAGMTLAATPGVPAFALDPALSMTLFLPPLLQSSAFLTVWRDFRANLRPILLLAIGAVAFTTAVVGWVVKLLEPSLPWAACLTLGAIISPPDAVAAGAVLEHLRLPRRLVTVLEGESLVNDASGLVLYRFGIAAALGGGLDAGAAALSFVLVAVGGVATGLVLGQATLWLLRRLSDTNLEIAASFLVAWASYLAAERIGASGVLSTVACGLVLGWRQHEVLRAETRLEAMAAWRFITFVLEALVFVLIGLSLRGVLVRLGAARTLELLPLAAAVTAVAVAARFVWVFPATYLPRWLWAPLRRRDPAPPLSYMLVIAWAGMRGVVSLAAALALPESFPGRDLVQVVTFGVIVGTVLIQGPTLGPLIAALRIPPDRPQAAVPEEMAARAAMETAALRAMEARTTDPLTGAIARDILPEFRDRADWAARTPGSGAARAERRARLTLRLEAIAAARAALLGLHRDGRIHEAVLRRLEHELDLEETRYRRLLGAGA